MLNITHLMPLLGIGYPLNTSLAHDVLQVYFYIFIEKKSAYKWTCAVETFVIQGSVVYWWDLFL